MSGTEKPQPQSNKPCTDFDEILEIIGSSGKFQKRLTYGFVGLISAFSPFLIFGNIFLLDIPDHWCHVDGAPAHGSPGFELWANATLPRTLGADGLWSYSQCQMYAEGNGSIPCPHGWDYDKTDYESTIPSDYNWVCDRDTYAADAFTFGLAGGALGVVVFGSLADKVGRKPILLLVAGINLLFRVVTLYVPGQIEAFFAAQFLMGSAFPVLYTSALVLVSEVSGGEFRSWSYAVFWMTWVAGNCLIPLASWATRGWFLFGLISTIPGILSILIISFMNESPRWLISRGRGEEAMEIIRKIAAINGVPIQEEKIMEMIGQIQVHADTSSKGKKKVGCWTLFKTPRIAKNTIALTLTLGMSSSLYYGVSLSITSMAGNRFLNYFFLALIELPAGFLAGILVEKTGRRWTQTGFFLLCFVSCLVSTLAVLLPGIPYLAIIGGLGIKFGVSISSLIVLLQCAEIFPTELRSTGTSLAATTGNIMSIAGPYVVFTGNWHVAYPYIIFILLSLVGVVSSSVLPETLGQSLPETVEDANHFGKGEKFWSYLPRGHGEKRGERGVDMSETVNA